VKKGDLDSVKSTFNDRPDLVTAIN